MVVSLWGGIFIMKTMMQKKLMTDVIKAVKEEMKEQAITVYRLAQLSGVSRVGIKGILDGVNSPSLDTLQKMLKPLGLQIRVEKEKKGNDK